jgi:hypothetical protein
MAEAEAAEQAREQANTGTKDVAENHRFDEAALERWMQANVAGYSGPLEVRQFKGGQSNPTYQLITPGKSTSCAANRRASCCPRRTPWTASTR